VDEQVLLVSHWAMLAFQWTALGVELVYITPYRFKDNYNISSHFNPHQ
jgi:hypothetical protein